MPCPMGATVQNFNFYVVGFLGGFTVFAYFLRFLITIDEHIFCSLLCEF